MDRETFRMTVKRKTHWLVGDGYILEQWDMAAPGRANEFAFEDWFSAKCRACQLSNRRVAIEDIQILQIPLVDWQWQLGNENV